MRYVDLKDEICNTWLQVNTQEMAQIRIALLELSTSGVEIPRMRDIYRCSDLAAALVLLEKWKILTPNKVDVLLRLTEQVGHHTEMVRERLQQYKKLNAPTEIRSSSSGCHGSNTVNQVYLNVCEYLSEDLRGRWIDLGRYLGLSELVNDLQLSPMRQKDRIYQVLEEHYHRTGNNAIPQLIQALDRCSLIRQRDYIRRHFAVNEDCYC